MQIVHEQQYVAGGHQQITVADTVVSLFASYLALIMRASTVAGKTDTNISATAVMLSAMDAPFYYTLDGSDPATDGSKGHPINQGDDLIVRGWRHIKNLKLIRQGTSSAKVNITPFFLESGV